MSSVQICKVWGNVGEVVSRPIEQLEKVFTELDMPNDFADSSSKCNKRFNAEEYLIRRFKAETFSRPVV